MNFGENPFHPSLEFKEIKSKGNIWSVTDYSAVRRRSLLSPLVRVGIGWRDLEVLKASEDKIVWFWIGSHAEYDKILGKK